MLDLTALKKSIHALQESLSVFQSHQNTADEALKRTLQAGVIQNFELTYKVSWKFIGELFTSGTREKKELEFLESRRKTQAIAIYCQVFQRRVGEF